MDMTHDSLRNIFLELMDVFGLKGKFVSYYSIKAGNINDTYSIITDEDGSTKQYIVQRVNHAVFPCPERIAANVFQVTRHIENKLKAEGASDIRRRVLRYYRTAGNDFYYVSADGNYWRVISYVYGSVNYNQPDIRILRNTGKAFGEFQRLLSDFPAEQLFETIAGFHDTERRFADLFSAAERDDVSRLSEVEHEVEFFRSKAGYASLFREMSESGEIPLRVVHNDTKCNNVMFDEFTGAPLAVIDLDTVMPGYVAYDFGDAVRFACNTASEDETDISKVSLDLDMFDAFAEGFVSEIKGMVSDKELETLPDGVLAITLELGARFLTDYLSGDVYFKCKMKDHNLVRTRVQIELARDIERKLPKMREHLRRIIDKTVD